LEKNWIEMVGGAVSDPDIKTKPKPSWDLDAQEHLWLPKAVSKLCEP
jgi:hypothetical protein